MFRKRIRIIIIAGLLLILFGCTAGQSDKDPWSLGMVTSMGGTQEDLTVQNFNYHISISYIGSSKVEIVDIIPLISDKPDVKSRITEESYQVVERKLTNMSVEGKLMISTGELTKQQIEELGPFITGITISWKENGRIHETTRSLR